MSTKKSNSKGFSVSDVTGTKSKIVKPLGTEVTGESDAVQEVIMDGKAETTTITIRIDSNLEAHAIIELTKAGYFVSNDEGPDKWIRENVIQLLQVFASQGHSGSSKEIVIELFNKLVNRENLTPLTFTDDEFVQVNYDEDLYQNVRNGNVFKDAKGIRSIESHTKQVVKRKSFNFEVVEDVDGGCWTGNVYELSGNHFTGRYFSRVYLKDETKELIPKVYLPVTEVEVEPEDYIMGVDKECAEMVLLNNTYDILWEMDEEIKGATIFNLQNRINKDK